MVPQHSLARRAGRMFVLQHAPSSFPQGLSCGGCLVVDPAEEFPPSALSVAEEYLQRHSPLYTVVWTCKFADEYPFHTDWPTDCGNSPRPYALGGAPSAKQMTSASPPSFSYGGAPILRPIGSRGPAASIPTLRASIRANPGSRGCLEALFGPFALDSRVGPLGCPVAIRWAPHFGPWRHFCAE